MAKEQTPKPEPDELKDLPDQSSDTPETKTAVTDENDPDPKPEPKEPADTDPLSDEAKLDILDPEDAGKPDTPDTVEPETTDTAAAGPWGNTDQPFDQDDKVADLPQPEEPEVEAREVEDTEPGEVEAEPRAPEKVVERVVERRGGGFPALIGGVVAAILGFLVASTDILAPYLPEGLRPADPAPAIAALETQLAEQSAAMDDLSSRVGELAPPDLAPLEARVSENADAVSNLTPQIDGVAERLSALEARLTDLEARPISEGLSDAAVAAFEQELADVRNSLSQEREAIEAMVADAEAKEAAAAEAARITAARGALTQVQSAIETGAPYEAALAGVADAGVSIPDVLSGNAAEGVVSLPALRAAFPPAAREALAAARADGASDDGGLGSFLARQLGARSVTPQDGDSADAVLSRMEAAVADGQLSDALSLALELPASAQDALSGWVSQAETRMAAKAAADDLAQSLTTN
ncbi:COG4223 family protein [Thalassococcus sp. S3]|uniref:COG4223 family protein n=1 Tax=Thalassococcus sp. S3 TaxID=2017482 RepID=UPI0010246374|nr:hypothetical protein [Thalassococcus sp. S3]QBF29635.1 hypothetical protein CFI11_00190 [Thalassococcus sp. S3]